MWPQGRDEDVVDVIYTHRKQRQEKLETRNDPLVKESTVRFPSTGWSTSLKRIPLFTKAVTDLHVSQSGIKDIDRSKQSHAVLTRMRKAKTFLEDEYLKDFAASDNEYFFFNVCVIIAFLKQK